MREPTTSVASRIWNCRHLPVILLIVAAVFAVLWFASFPNHFDPAKTGSLGQWLSAVGTTSAFAVTFVQLRRNIRQQAKADQDKRRAQASAVSAWAQTAQDASNYHSVGVQLRNGSTDPVWETWCRSFSGADDNAPFEDQFVGLIPPGGDPKLTFEPRQFTSAEAINQATVELRFRDSNGITWLRQRNGALQEFTDTAAAAWDVLGAPTGTPGHRRRT